MDMDFIGVLNIRYWHLTVSPVKGETGGLLLPAAAICCITEYRVRIIVYYPEIEGLASESGCISSI
jgi:hypothetical protein